MKRRKKIVTTPFDSYRTPPKQNLFAMPILWLLCWILTRKGRLKIHRERMEGLKPPFLVLGTHLSFTDFYVTPLALFPHRANYVSELEGFEAFGEWVYRQTGCLGTRKFIPDVPLVRNIKRVIDRKGILVLYPEARYANVGTSSELTASVSKLAKLLKVPVVVLNMRGNYLQSPIWNLAIRRQARLDATITQVFTAEELEKAPLEEVGAKLQAAMTFDEYAWQYETALAITYEKRAEGLDAVLYQCPACKSAFQMAAEGAELFCKCCGARWRMTEYGKMEHIAGVLPADTQVGTALSHIPDWYEWERTQVEAEIDAGQYALCARVHIEALPNAVNFIDLGEGLLKHDETGFSLTFTPYGEQREQTRLFPPDTMSSVHTEYNYRNKGQCITLSTPDNTYFLFPRETGFNVTKIQFAAEYFHGRAKRRRALNRGGKCIRPGAARRDVSL